MFIAGFLFGGIFGLLIFFILARNAVDNAWREGFEAGERYIQREALKNGKNNL